MKGKRVVIWAHIGVALMSVAAGVAVLQGMRWAWLVAALGLAVLADLRDVLRWRA